MDRQKMAVLLVILSVAGLLDSVYLTYMHYAADNSTICNLVGDLNCDIVNKSQFSKVGGILSYFGFYYHIPIPVSILGGMMFLLFLIIGTLLLKKNQSPVFGLYLRRRTLIDTLFYSSAASFAFAMFLIYVQAYILRTWCLFCLILDAAIISVLGVSITLKFFKFR